MKASKKTIHFDGPPCLKGTSQPVDASRRPGLLSAVGLLVVLSGCSEEPKPWEVTHVASADRSAAPRGPSDVPVVTDSMELLDFRFTTAVRNKDPVDRYVQAAPGDRVYAHITLRNRTGETRSIRLDFSVNDNPRTQVTLKVEDAWSWRTWAYNTILPTDEEGELLLQVTDDQHRPVTEQRLPIRSKREVSPGG